MTRRLLGAAGHLEALEAVRVEVVGGTLREVSGSAFVVPCELLLLAMGFVGPEREGLLDQLGVQLDARGSVAAATGRTSVPRVFAAGDMVRGQSLVVWAIAEGRTVARSVAASLES